MRQKMQYKEIKQGYFLARPNRFIAHIEIEGQVEVCHVKNTGRCRELLTPRAVVYVECHDDQKRKTKYSLIAVKKGGLLINMDSQAPNKVVNEWLQGGGLVPAITLLKPECKHGTSRFDFYVETLQQKLFIEVKGVTLEENGIAMFPDAPTERGVKHLDELAQAVREGYAAAVIFVIQMRGVTCFKPNRRTHAAFAEALLRAQQAGVQVLAYDCKVTPDSLVLGEPVPCCL
ncbi:DNA/RNA nuclease SfsA [uncultured Phascolarctobacterium sp.]|uniref:DNA/RNA nuclease SfsA n=2 Tax=uncultured Phascolarctobacterium sp. TaxID=512296 RepID=UPI0025F1BC7D|nr:DNA/RNA nuclease SfsA [uncultured Phascolarctobacterium sp.]